MSDFLRAIIRKTFHVILFRIIIPLSSHFCSEIHIIIQHRQALRSGETHVAGYFTTPASMNHLCYSHVSKLGGHTAADLRKCRGFYTSCSQEDRDSHFSPLVLGPPDDSILQKHHQGKPCRTPLRSCFLTIMVAEEHHGAFSGHRGSTPWHDHAWRPQPCHTQRVASTLPAGAAMAVRPVGAPCREAVVFTSVGDTPQTHLGMREESESIGTPRL